MSDFLPYNRQRALLLTLVWGLVAVGCWFALRTTSDLRRPGLWIALVLAVTLCVVGLRGLYAHRGRSGVTISSVGITRQLGPRRLHYAWPDVDLVQALDLAPGVSAIHISLRDGRPTATLGTAALVGGSDRALTAVSAVLDSLSDPPQVTDTRRPRARPWQQRLRDPLGIRRER